MSVAAAMAGWPAPASHHDACREHLVYRPLAPSDFAAIKAEHARLFPIDYDDAFFHNASHGLERIWSCAAFALGPLGEEAALAGFITAKTVALHECDASDRQHMGLLSAVADHDRALYILTLGVAEAFRHRGIARALIRAAVQHAADTRCRAAFLHVISYNTAAQALYAAAGFTCVARLAQFYCIATGRQPDPSVQLHDAFLFVHWAGAGVGLASPWDVLSLAVHPLRSALGRIQHCMAPAWPPWRQQVQPVIGGTAAPAARTQDSGHVGSASWQHTKHPSPQSWPDQRLQPQPWPAQPPPLQQQQQQRPQDWQAQDWQAQDWQAQWQAAQQHQHQQQPGAQQQPGGQQQQQQQRMLRWLFQGSSRSEAAQQERGWPPPA